LVKLGLGIWLALLLELNLIYLLTPAQAAGPQPESPTTTITAPIPLASTLTYARVITGGAPVYQHPLHATQGITPIRSLDAGYVWVTLVQPEPLQHEDQLWYWINPDEYVPADYLQVYQPSTFRGVIQPVYKTFAWMVFDAWSAASPGELPGDGAVLLKRYTVVPIYEQAPVSDRLWYRVGEQQWVEQGMVGIVSPKPRPEGVPAGDKWIEIDLYEQTLAAYENDQIVYATLISSGLPWWQTEQGLFRVWVKIKQAKMSGREGYPDYYFLEDVPWSMYFNRDFALHGAYWHDRFGLRHSHGCVNISLADAKWLFDWTTPTGQGGWTLADEENIGAWIWVHE
jgi:lipoprotein-anchoring transpeptidase ErfK/SrfK